MNDIIFKKIVKSNSFINRLQKSLSPVLDINFKNRPQNPFKISFHSKRATDFRKAHVRKNRLTD